MLAARPVGRRQAALAGLYLMAFSFGMNIWLAPVGGTLAIVAAMLAYPLFWRDLLRLRLFWISLGLSLYLLLRGIIGVGLEVSGREPL